MKKLFLLFVAMTLAAGVQAQKYAFVNTEKIFLAIPDYNKAIESLDELAKTYQAEIDAEFDKISETYDRYQFQKGNLSEGARAQVENTILQREKQMEEKQESYFGADGAIMKKRIELLKPIQDKVFALLDNMTRSGRYDMIIDISNNPSIVSYNSSLDITSEVLKALGISN